MALKSYRTEVNNGAYVNVDNFMNTTGEAGYVVVFDTTTSGSGSAFDAPGSVVKLSAATSDKPAGILLMDVVNKDLSQTHLNQNKREGQVGGKVAILRRGVVTLNCLSGGSAPAPGDACHFGPGGVVSTTATSARIGTFVSSRDSEGYAKVDVTII